MTYDQLLLLHAVLIEEDDDGVRTEWIGAANMILASAGIASAIYDKEAADVIIRKFLTGLLESEDYTSAATLLWGQDMFDTRPKYVSDIFRVIKDNAMVLLQGASSVSKCLGLGTKVLMFDGTTRSIEDVKPGDKLMGDDSTERNVISCGRGTGQLYRIVPERGEPWVCNDAHILSLRWNHTKRCGSGYSSTTRVKNKVVDIRIKDYLSMSIDKKNSLKQYSVGIELPEQPVPYDPYIYGSWLGDGGFDVPALHTPDGPMARRWCEYFDSIGFKITSGYHDKCPMWCARVHANGGGGGEPNPFTDFIRTSRLGEEKTIREDYLLNSRINRLNLLAWLIDSDGWVIHKTCYGFVSKFKGLAQQTQWLAKSVGLAATLHPRIHSIKSIGFSAEYWHVHISGRGITDIPTLEKHAIESVSPKNLTNTSFRVEDEGIGCIDSFAWE